MVWQSSLGNLEEGSPVHYSTLGVKHLYSGVRRIQYFMGTWFGKSYWPITQQPLGEQRAGQLGFGNTPGDLASRRGMWLLPRQGRQTSLSAQTLGG